MPNSRPKKRRLLLKSFLLMLLVIGVSAGAWGLWRYHGPAPEREIFRGITYGCERVPDTDESGGLVHWIRADLNVPGVSLYATPLSPVAQAKGFEYLLQYTSTAVSEQGLAAAVNGTLFSSDSGLIQMPGDIALSTETIVANHQVNHVDPNTYLLWWGDDLVSHLEMNKPPTASVLAQAKWAIGGGQPNLSPGWISDGKEPNRRTEVGADPQKKRVWIACFDKASYNFGSRWLKNKGASIGVMVDGGGSMAMVIGKDAKNVRPGTVAGNWRPVANHFGFRADPLP